MLNEFDSYKGFTIKCGALGVDGGYVGVTSIGFPYERIEVFGIQPLTSAFTNAAAAVKAAICWSRFIIDVVEEQRMDNDQSQAVEGTPPISLAA